jgi:hypothetical protein
MLWEGISYSPCAPCLGSGATSDDRLAGRRPLTSHERSTAPVRRTYPATRRRGTWAPPRAASDPTSQSFTDRPAPTAYGSTRQRDAGGRAVHLIGRVAGRAASGAPPAPAPWQPGTCACSSGDHPGRRVRSRWIGSGGAGPHVCGRALHCRRPGWGGRNPPLDSPRPCR